MSRIPIIAQTQAAALTTFSVGGPFWLIGEGFATHEQANLEQANNAGNGYFPVTNKEGVLCVTKYPNTVYCEVPAGTYRINKPATEQLTSVSYEEG